MIFFDFYICYVRVLLLSFAKNGLVYLGFYLAVAAAFIVAISKTVQRKDASGMSKIFAKDFTNTINVRQVRTNHSVKNHAEIKVMFNYT